MISEVGMNSEKKGYILVELLISLGIMSFVSILIIAFFTTNLNNFAKIKNASELQFQSQYILNFISNKIMESKGVFDIRTDKNERVIDSAREFSISKILLLFNEQKGSCYIFEVRNGGIIYYGNGNPNADADAELGRYISELKAAPYPEGKTFAQASAIVITIKLVKGNQSYEAQQIIYMRSS